MKALFRKLTTRGGQPVLVPRSNDALRELRALDDGAETWVTIRRGRDQRHHGKYFALIAAVHDMLPEPLMAIYPTEESLRVALQIAAGYADWIPNLETGELIPVPRSIAFDAMDQGDFEKLYKDVILAIRHTLCDHVADDALRHAIEERALEFA